MQKMHHLGLSDYEMQINIAISLVIKRNYKVLQVGL